MGCVTVSLYNTVIEFTWADKEFQPTKFKWRDSEENQDICIFLHKYTYRLCWAKSSRTCPPTAYRPAHPTVEGVAGERCRQGGRRMASPCLPPRCEDAAKQGRKEWHGAAVQAEQVRITDNWFPFSVIQITVYGRALWSPKWRSTLHITLCTFDCGVLWVLLYFWIVFPPLAMGTLTV